MTYRWKLWTLCLLCSSALALGACGSDDDPATTASETPGTTTTGGTVVPPPSSTSSSPPTTGVAPLPACNQQGRACEAASQSTDNYFCDIAGGVCLSRCDVEATNEVAGANCPQTTWCLPLEGAGDGGGGDDPDVIEDPETGETLDGVCTPRTCDGTIFENNCATGETCLPFGNSASFCVPAGTGVAGEPCPDPGLITGACGVGLLCFEGNCTEPCDVGDSTACGDEECLAVFDQASVGGGVVNRPGACGTGCEPFASGTCPDGKACTFAGGRSSITRWYCGEAPESPLPAGADCSPLEAGQPTQECEEGYICLNTGTEAAPELACTQLCDPTGAATAPGASCPTGQAATDLIDATAFEEVSDFAVADAGTYMVDVLSDDDDSVIDSLSYTVAEGTVETLVALLDADDDLFVAALTDLAPGDDEVTNGLRALHGSAAAGPVEVSLAGSFTSLAIAFSEVFALGEGELNVLAVADDEVAIEGNWELDTDFWYTIFALPGATAGDAPSFVAWTVDADTTLDAGEAGVRLLHAAPSVGAVDIYVGGDLVAEDVSFGEGSMSEYLTFDTDDYQVQIFETGADPEEATALLSDIYTLNEGFFYTIVAAEGDSPFLSVVIEEWTAAAEDDEALVRVGHFATGVGEVTLYEERALDSLAFGESLVGDDAGFIAFDDDGTSWFVNLRGEDDGLADAPALRIGPFEVEGLMTAIVIDTEDGLDTLIFSDDPDTDWPELDGDEGAFRLVHAIESVDAVRLALPGQTRGVCLELTSGLGGCLDGCDPFPRMGDGNYGCPEENASCRPIESGGSIEGLCVDFGDRDIAAYDDCPQEENGTFGPCEDFAVCLDFGLVEDANFDESTAAPYCSPLCQPFTGTCENTDAKCAFLFNLQESFCQLDTELDLGIGDACTPPSGEPNDFYTIAVCGDNRRCIGSGPGTVPTCTQFCSQNSQCPSGTCTIPAFQGIDDFGICQ